MWADQMNVLTRSLKEPNSFPSFEQCLVLANSVFPALWEHKYDR